MIKIFLICFLLVQNTDPMVLYDFSDTHRNEFPWRVIDDVVMGGRSDGTMSMNEDGFGIFKGRVSLENNGGFSSTRLTFDPVNIEGYHKVALHIKGDGKKYQFRIKAHPGDWYSYIQYFETSGEWEKVVLDLGSMYPSFRGRRLNMKNWDKNQIGEIALLIGNKKAEDFCLEIKKIELI